MRTILIMAAILLGCRAEEAYCNDLDQVTCEAWVSVEDPPVEALCGMTHLTCAENPAICGVDRVVGPFTTRSVCTDGVPVCPNGSVPTCVFVPWAEGSYVELPEQCGGRVLEPCE